MFGIEADFQGSTQGQDATAGIFTVSLDLWFATLRGRLGYAAWDRGLLYVTGGAALTQIKVSVSALGTTVSSDDTQAGWVLGAGVEHMFAPKWSAKFEYLYVDSGDSSVTLFGTTVDARAKNSILRAGVNYHFQTRLTFRLPLPRLPSKTSPRRASGEVFCMTEGTVI